MHSARLRSREGNWIASLNIYRRIISENPKFSPAHCELARLYIDRDDFCGARTLVENVLAVEKDNSEASFLLGVIEYVEGNFDASLRAYRTVEKKDGLDVNLAMNIALVCESLGLYRDAIKHLEYAIARGEPNIKIFEVLADLFRSVGEYDNEERVLENALNKFPGEASLHFNLGLARLKLGNFLKSEVSFKTANRLVPDDPGPLDELVRLYVRSGRVGEAILQLHRLIEIDSDNAQNRLRLARAHHSLGESEKTLQVLEEAARIFPGNASIIKELDYTRRLLENRKDGREASGGEKPETEQ